MINNPFAQISGVFFDLDGTLKISTPTGIDAIVGYMHEAGFTISVEARRMVHRFADEYWADQEQVEQDMEQFGPDAFWENHIRSQILAMHLLPLGQTPDDQLVKTINRRFATEFLPESHIAPGTVELLTKLRANGITVGLVSNRPMPLQEPAQRLGIYEFFDFTLAAGEIGSWKPDQGIFDHARNMAGNIPAHQAAYIGDNYFADVLGAKNAGLKPIFIDPLRAFPEASAIALVITALADLLPYLD